MDDGRTAREADQRSRLKLGLETVLGVPFTTGNAIDIYENGVEIFPAMLEAIEAAERRIEFLTFVYWTGDIAERFVEALSGRARAGVEVLVMLDGFGAHPMPRHLIERMEEAGVRVRWFRPLPRWRVWRSDNRTHRKVLVCDARIGFTGGVGIAAEWEGDAEDPDHWRDSHFRIRGPAVLGLRGAFFEDWMESELSVAPAISFMADPGRPGGLEAQVIPSAASIGRSDVAALHDALIVMAKRRLRVATAYFSPTSDTTARLVEAAGRGVAVEILFPGPHVDKRLSELAGSNAIEPLLQAGVAIHTYQPTMYHTKLITVDGELAVLGSANFNHRSIAKDDEIAVNVLDRDFTALIDAQIDRDLARADKVGLGEWADRSLWRRFREALASIVTPET